MPEPTWKDRLIKAAKHAVGGKMMNVVFPGSTAAYDAGNAIGNAGMAIGERLKNTPVQQIQNQPVGEVVNGYQGNAFGPTSIPGLRPATVNGEPVSETELVMTKLSNDAGKKIAEKYPGISDKAREAAAAIERLKAPLAQHWQPGTMTGPIDVAITSSPGHSLQEYINKVGADARKKDGLDIELD